MIQLLNPSKPALTLLVPRAPTTQRVSIAQGSAMTGWDRAFGTGFVPAVPMPQLRAPCGGPLWGMSPSSAAARTVQGDFQECCLLTAVPWFTPSLGKRVFASLGSARILPVVTGQVTSPTPKSCGSWSGKSLGHQVGKVPSEQRHGWLNAAHKPDSSALCRGRRSQALERRRMNRVTLVEKTRAPVGIHVTGRDTMTLPNSAHGGTEGPRKVS